jgi:hypothetical protein
MVLSDGQAFQGGSAKATMRCRRRSALYTIDLAPAALDELVIPRH